MPLFSAQTGGESGKKQTKAPKARDRKSILAHIFEMHCHASRPGFYARDVEDLRRAPQLRVYYHDEPSRGVVITRRERNLVSRVLRSRTCGPLRFVRSFGPRLETRLSWFKALLPPDWTAPAPRHLPLPHSCRRRIDRKTSHQCCLARHAPETKPGPQEEARIK